MLGRLKRVDNIDAKFGSDPWYWFLKVQTPGHAEKNEEYWLVTEEEAIRFSQRADSNPEDAPHRRSGVLVLMENTSPKFGSADLYHAVKIIEESRTHSMWMLTDFDLGRIRERVSKNAEDIAANREGWLADLLD